MTLTEWTGYIPKNPSPLGAAEAQISLIVLTVLGRNTEFNLVTVSDRNKLVEEISFFFFQGVMKR